MATTRVFGWALNRRTLDFFVLRKPIPWIFQQDNAHIYYVYAKDFMIS